MTKKLNLFRKHYNLEKDNFVAKVLRNSIFYNDSSINDDLNYDEYDDSIILDEDINYDNYDDISFNNKKNSFEYFYDLDDYID